MAAYQSTSPSNQTELREQARRQSDKKRVTTALKAAATAGYAVSKFEITTDGRIVVFVRTSEDSVDPQETSLDVRKLL